MKVVMTLLVRDEVDILDEQLAFHLDTDVDYVIATDHRSSDGTTEILERYAREGHLHLLRNDSELYLQGEWVTEMARLAATDFAADWVINADADEFWWPRQGQLKVTLASVPSRYGIVRCFERHFAPRPEDDRHFAERMTVRVTPHAAQTTQEDPFQGAMQVVHRADPSVRVAPGNHDLLGGKLLALRGWYPIEVFHFPLRTLEQSRQKYLHKLHACRTSKIDVGGHTRGAWRAIEDGRYEEWYAKYVVDDEALARGRADGTLTLDTRLRDALRLLRGTVSSRASTGNGSRSVLSLVEAAAYAHEMQAFDDFDAQVRIIGRVDAIDTRLAELERAATTRVRHGVGRLAGIASAR